MVGHGTKFDHNKHQAIAALLSFRSVEQAAGAVGVSANTLMRWMKEPEFAAELRQARAAVFTQSMAQLQDATGVAVKTVLKLMVDDKVKPAVRLRAAEIVLQHASRSFENEQLLVCVAELRQAAGAPPEAPEPVAALPWPGKALPSPNTELAADHSE